MKNNIVRVLRRCWTIVHNIFIHTYFEEGSLCLEHIQVSKKRIIQIALSMCLAPMKNIFQFEKLYSNLICFAQDIKNYIVLLLRTVLGQKTLFFIITLL